MNVNPALMVCLWGEVAPAVMGFSSDGSSLTRSFNRTVTVTNSPIVVTAAFTNGGMAPLRGFYYTEHLPTGLEVSTLSVSLNGWTITNYTFETGPGGDVYPGHVPFRWLLEHPAGFVEYNPIPFQTGVRIVYSLRSSAPGAFCLSQFSWVGYDPAGSNACFGHSEYTDQRTVSFVVPTNAAVLTGQYATKAFMLWLTGWPGRSYVIEATARFSNWIPLVTNTSPFNFADTNVFESSERYYRARLFD